jgi:hypothetical protein
MLGVLDVKVVRISWAMELFNVIVIDRYFVSIRAFRSTRRVHNRAGPQRTRQASENASGP